MMQTYIDHIPAGVGFVAPQKPSLNMRHIDGPYICFRDGQLHWLTIRERIALWFGLTDAVKIEQKRRPNLCKLLRGEMLSAISSPKIHSVT